MENKQESARSMAPQLIFQMNSFDRLLDQPSGGQLRLQGTQEAMDNGVEKNEVKTWGSSQRLQELQGLFKQACWQEQMIKNQLFLQWYQALIMRQSTQASNNSLLNGFSGLPNSQFPTLIQSTGFLQQQEFPWNSLSSFPQRPMEVKETTPHRAFQNKVPLNHPPMDSIQSGQAPLLTKRDSSSRSFGPNNGLDDILEFPTTTASFSTHSDPAEAPPAQELEKDQEKEAANLLSRIEGGFEILKTTITTQDMAFIRNYSRIIGYPLKTTQRNTKMGYFTAICTKNDCPAKIVVRKFSFMSSSRIQHNH